MDLQEFKGKMVGPQPTLFTPFKANDVFEVDHDAIRQNLRYLINNGIKTVISTGSIGEFSSVNGRCSRT